MKDAPYDIKKPKSYMFELKFVKVSGEKTMAGQRIRNVSQKKVKKHLRC